MLRRIFSRSSARPCQRRRIRESGSLSDYPTYRELLSAPGANCSLTELSGRLVGGRIVQFSHEGQSDERLPLVLYGLSLCFLGFSCPDAGAERIAGKQRKH